MAEKENRFYFEDGRYKIGYIYYIVFRAFRVLYDSLGRVEIGGLENVPATGAFLLASNHLSHLDPPLVGGQFTREIHFVARKSLMASKFLTWLYTNLKIIPIDRDNPEVASFKKMFALIREGKPIGVFPEGTRSRDGNFLPAKAGIGMLACKFGVLVIPARVFGTYEMLGAGHPLNLMQDLAINYAPALDPKEFDPGPKHPDRYQVASDNIMEKIKSIPWPEPPKF